jgi:hypothetical protein
MRRIMQHGRKSKWKVKVISDLLLSSVGHQMYPFNVHLLNTIFSDSVAKSELYRQTSARSQSAFVISE